MLLASLLRHATSQRKDDTNYDPNPDPDPDPDEHTFAGARSVRWRRVANARGSGMFTTLPAET